jgi:hypothetical protein
LVDWLISQYGPSTSVRDVLIALDSIGLPDDDSPSVEAEIFSDSDEMSESDLMGPDDDESSEPEPSEDEDNYRPKGTDEAYEATSRTSDATHGGDGNSGECDHRAATPSTVEAQGAAENEGNPGPVGHCASTGVSPTPGSEIADASESERTACGSESDGSDDPCESTDAASDPADKAVGDEHTLSEVGSDTSDSELGIPKGPQDAFGGTPNPSPREGTVWGGLTFSHGECFAARTVKRIADALVRILKPGQVGLTGTSSPRYEGRSLVREIVSHRYQLARARRQEVERERVVITVDASGSCSNTGPVFWAALKRVCESLNGKVLESCDNLKGFVVPDSYLTIVIHSNGLVSREKNVTIADIVGVIKPRMVIEFGDGDAITSWRKIAEMACVKRFIVLNPYMSAVLNGKPVKREATYWKIGTKNFEHYVGVGDGEATLAALRLIEKSK